MIISIDKNAVNINDKIMVGVRVINTGKAQAKSVLIDGTPPLGLKVVDGDLRQVYESIAPGEQKEYRVVLKSEEMGNYSINLRTVYSDNAIGILSSSEIITVANNDNNYFYLIIPIVGILIGFALFTIKKHKEYKY